MRRALLLGLLFACRGETGVDPLPEPEDPLAALVIETPAPATWTAVGRAEVTGTYDNVEDVRINGEVATTTDTAFSGGVDLIRGTNLVEATGTSPGGTTYATHHAVIAGDTGYPELPVEDAALIRVNEPGLDRISALASGLITGDMIAGLLVTGDPIYELTGDPSVTVTPTAFSLGGVGMDIDPGEGTARLELTLTDLSISADVFGRYGSGYAELSQTITAEKVVVTGTLGVTVVNGRFQTTLTDVDVVITGFGLDTSKWPTWLVGELTDLVLTEVVEGALRLAITEVLPPVLDEQLNSLELSFDVELLARLLSVEADLTGATFDPDGLAVNVDLGVMIDGVNPVSAPGYLVAPDATPTPDHTSDLAVGVADDMLNLATFEAWRAGMLTYQLSTEDGTLPGYVLDAIGGARTGIVTIRADLPPTIVEVDGTLRAQVGELSVRLDTIDGANGEYVIMAVGGHIDLDLSVQDGVMKVGFGEKDLRITVRETDWSGSLVEATEQIEGLLPLDIALGLLEDIEIPLPTFAGLTVKSATVSRDASTVHTLVGVSLEPAPE